MPQRLPTLADSLTICPDAVYKEIAGEAVVLNLATGIYFGLDDTSARLWTLIAAHGSLRRVRDEMLREYDVDADRLERDLLAFADQLVSSDLAVYTSESR